MLDGVEDMVGDDPSCNPDVREVILSLRIFPLDAETVGLVNGSFRKQ
jgi:hypothetical protein